MISYSRVDTYRRCPRKYKYLYIDKIRIEREPTPSDAIYLGKALDVGIQYGYPAAEKEYLSHFPIVTDECINWLMQIEYWLPKVQKFVKDGQFQVEVRKDDFIGFIDYLDDNVLIDFKFSNNGDLYAESPQIILYADCLPTRPEILQYVCVPKSFIRKKKDEDLTQFRKRLLEDMRQHEIDVRTVKYDPTKVSEFKTEVGVMLNDSEYLPIVGNQCAYCEYKSMCESEKPIKRKVLDRKLLNI